jgi:hypothetical protein
MNYRGIVVGIFALLLSVALLGCGGSDTVDEAGNNPSEESTQETTVEPKDTEPSSASDALKDRAEEEGVSVSDMETMIEELTVLTAEKYGDTAEGYLALLEAEGKTPFDEFARAADMMGLTIQEYYEYEKNAASTMTEEEKEIMQGMGDAMKEIQEMDLSEYIDE